MPFFIALSVSTFLHVTFIVLYITLAPLKNFSTQTMIPTPPTQLSITEFKPFNPSDSPDKQEAFEKPIKAPAIAEEKPLSRKPIHTPKKMMTSPQKNVMPSKLSTNQEISQQEISTQTPSSLMPSLTPSAIGLPNKTNITDAISSAIMQHKSYPKRAQRLGIEGEIVISFTWKDQTLSNLHIVKSSGHPILDEHALKILKEAQKIFPASTELLELNIPIVFVLK